jgi:hypothetical protein
MYHESSPALDEPTRSGFSVNPSRGSVKVHTDCLPANASPTSRPPEASRLFWPAVAEVAAENAVLVPEGNPGEVMKFRLDRPVRSRRRIGVS